MNERIQELAEQAGSTHKQSLGVYQFYEHELKEFAGLIVQECIEQCSCNPESNDEWDKGVRWATNQIKRHFGVEE